MELKACGVSTRREGKKELLPRCIGANEIDAIDLCTAVPLTSRRKKSSRRRIRNGGRAPLRSAFHQLSGRKDGLYWAEAKVDRASLIGSLVMEAAGEGYDVSGAKPAP